jgi:hypothetical protein
MLLVCGSRKKYSDEQKTAISTRIVEKIIEMDAKYGDESTEIVEGCCKGSPDVFAEEFSKAFPPIKIHHHPAVAGNNLRRNLEMVELADECLCFWDGYSYGTAFTIAHCVIKGIPVEVVRV